MTKAKSNMLVTPILIVIICSLTIVSNFRNNVYKNKVALWANAVVRSPNKQRTHENYGFALSAVGFYREALAQFERVLSLKDGSVPMRDVYREIGVVQYRMGNLDDAIMSWQKGLRFAPLDADLMTNISIAFLKKQDYDGALPYAQNAAQANPLRAEPLNTLGEIFLYKGDFNKAIEYFLKAIELEPDSPFRYWNVALSLEKARRYEEAYRYMNRFYALTADPAGRREALMFMQHMQKRGGFK